MSLLTVEGLGQGFGDKTLYEDANFVLNKEDHMGVTGQNGVGKSTLIKILTGEILPDGGSVKWQNKVTVGYLDQYAKLTPGLTLRGFLQTAFAGLYEEEKRLNQLYVDYGESGDDKLLAKAGALQTDLEEHNFYDLDTEIDQVARGLGFARLDQDVSELSGGQRSKLILAKLLLEKPDAWFWTNRPTTWTWATLTGWSTT